MYFFISQTTFKKKNNASVPSVDLLFVFESHSSEMFPLFVELLPVCQPNEYILFNITFFVLSLKKKKKKSRSCEKGLRAATKVTGMKDDAPTRPLVHMKDRKETVGNQNDGT